MSSTQPASSDDDSPKHSDDWSDREAMGFANTRDFMLAYGLKLEILDDYEEAKVIRDALREKDAQEYGEQELSRSSAAQESVGDQQPRDPQQDEHQHEHDDDTEDQSDSEGSEASYYDPNGYDSHLSHSCSSDNDFYYKDDAEPDYDASGHDDYHYDDYGDDYYDDGYD
jgi:hypothetical protein